MISAFQLIRKWFTGKPREAVPPWHAEVKLSNNIGIPRLFQGVRFVKVHENCRVAVCESITAKVRPMIQISVHTDESHHRS